VKTGTVAARVTAIIVEQLGVGDSEVTLDATFEDLACDSLDCLEIVMTIEENFELEIPDADTWELKTVGDVVAYVEAKTKIGK
jgi:acyl carrier protein